MIGRFFDAFLWAVPVFACVSHAAQAVSGLSAAHAVTSFGWLLCAAGSWRNVER